MAYKASPQGAGILRLMVRLVLITGAIVALWLLAPTTANALEPSSDLDEPVTDTVTDTVDSVETTLTDAVEEPSDSVNDTIDSVGSTLAEPIEDPSETATNLVVSVETTVTQSVAEINTETDRLDVGGSAEIASKAVSSSARDLVVVAGEASPRLRNAVADAVSTVEDPAGVAANITERLQEAVSSVDSDIIAAVEATTELATAIVSIVPWLDDDDGTAISDDHRHVTSVRFEDRPAFSIRGPPLEHGSVGTVATSAGGAASSSGWPGMPDGSGRLPAAAGSTARDFLRGASSSPDVAAILVASLIALGLLRWSFGGAEQRPLPPFLRLAGRPG